MYKYFVFLISFFVVGLSPVSYAYFLDVDGTHYDVTWVTDSFNNIVAADANAFSDNPWWQDYSLSFDFRKQWVLSGDPTAGLIEFAVEQRDLSGTEDPYSLGTYCQRTDCVITAISAFGAEDYIHEYIFTENMASVVWNYAFATVIPEPNTSVLFVTGLFAIVVSVKRKAIRPAGFHLNWLKPQLAS